MRWARDRWKRMPNPTPALPFAGLSRLLQSCLSGQMGRTVGVANVRIMKVRAGTVRSPCTVQPHSPPIPCHSVGLNSWPLTVAANLPFLIHSPRKPRYAQVVRGSPQSLKLRLEPNLALTRCCQSHTIASRRGRSLGRPTTIDTVPVLNPVAPGCLS